MSDGMPPDDPFGGLPFMADLMKMFQGQASGSSDTARQLAHTIANDGESEANIDPTDRIAVEQLVRVAELQVAQATDLPVGPITVEVGNRSQWADRTIADYRPLFETLTDSMAAGMQLPADLPADDPMAAMLGNLTKMMGPMMMGMTTGSMIGHLARRAMGGYELPVPRPTDQPILISLRNVDTFGDDWSIERDDLRLWVCLHEVTHHAVLAVPHVRGRLTDLLQRHAAAVDTVTEYARTGDITISNQDARGALGRLGLQGEKALRKVSDLSGGEKARVALAMFSLKPSNCYLVRLIALSGRACPICSMLSSSFLISWTNLATISTLSALRRSAVHLVNGTVLVLSLWCKDP